MIPEGEPASSRSDMIEPSAVLDALASVRDPELDTSIVELGFVTACWLDDARTAHIRLRLPTYFCAPNFAYLMVSDAHDAVVGVDGVEAVDISLEDHFASDEINVGVAARAGFVASFGGLAERELGELRRTFLRKAALGGTRSRRSSVGGRGTRPQRARRAHPGRPSTVRGPGPTPVAPRRARAACSRR